jgi:hypothetical protein
MSYGELNEFNGIGLKFTRNSPFLLPALYLFYWVRLLGYSHGKGMLDMPQLSPQYC